MKICEKYALMFKALSDETRLKIYCLVSAEEICGCELLEEVNITQPTLSYHMKQLCGAGLVNARKDGAWMRYTLNKDGIKSMEDFLAGLKNNKG